MPEPDVLIARDSRHAFDHRHPRADETALVVEVSDSSLDVDRGVKQMMYARDRVPVYWIVNLVDRVVEVYSDPSDDEPARYLTRRDYAEGKDVPVSLDGHVVGTIAVSDVLPVANA